MKNGEILKSRLGLSHLKHVMISRVLGTAYKTYIVFYDSGRVNLPITTQRALKSDHIAMLFQYPFTEKPICLPLIHLEDFNGPLTPAMFFVVDISGTRGDRKNKVDLKREGSISLSCIGKLEELTLGDFKATDSASAFTKRTRRQRNQAVGAENTTAKLVDVDINTVEDHVTFIFKTTATIPIYPPGTKFQKTNPDTLSLQRNSDKSYELHLRLLNFFEWKEAQDIGQALTAKDIKEVLGVADLQVFSTSPSFHFQGANYYCSQVDSSIYPTNIEPQFWNSPDLHGKDYFLDKHLFGLLRSIDFFLNQMANMLTKRLRDRDLL